jgi:chromosome partitioning protein
MTSYFGYDPDTLDNSVYQLFQGQSAEPGIAPHAVLHGTSMEGLELLPASTALATLDRQLGSQEGKGLVIQRALKQLENRFDYVLIDCPPLLGILMVNALAAAEKLLVPVQTEFLALKGLERMMRTLQMVMRARKNKLEFLVIPTMFDKRTKAATECLQVLQEQYGDDLSHEVVPVDTKFREASKRGIPLSMMMPSSRGAKAYAELLKTLEGQENEPILRLVKS